ncbi:MAG TPA: DMT family transporter [Steroidobacteraceae bacterium]|nr:DMT family transporter [Steroidobacteraceae bacterium]
MGYNHALTMRSPTFSVAAPARAPAEERLRGIASMIAAVFAFSIMDASLKRLSSDYGPLQVACMRCLSSLVFLVAAIAARRSWTQLRGGQPLLHACRGALGIGMLAAFVYAVHRLTMAQTYSLFMAAPLLMTALSVPMHGERVSARRWLAIAVGMSGVLVILHPWNKGFASFAAAAAAAAATICYSLSALTVRSLGPRNSSLGMVFWNLALVGLGSGALAVFDWHPVTLAKWPWLAAVGIAGALGQYWITDAFRRAPPSVVAPFEYTSILWAFAIDWVFWSATPSKSLMAGAAIVVGSGIYVIWDERRAVAALALISASPPP